jgi:PAS domain S-box-containing protein
MEANEKPTVLVVDDESANLGVLFEHLRHTGLRILVAQNGQAALQILERFQPDIILLDIMLPDADGFELCRQFKEESKAPDVPVIFLSALTDTAVKIRALELDAVDYISKPFQPEEITARIKRHLLVRDLQRQLQERNALLQQEIREREKAEETLHAANASLDAAIRNLRKSEERFRSLSECSPLGIFGTDGEGLFRYTNRRWQEISGLGPQESLGDGWIRAIHPEDRDAIHAEWKKCVSEGRGLKLYLRILTLQGDVRWAHAHAAPIRSDAGEIIGYVGTIEDVTDRKRMEEDLLKARKLEAMGTFAGGIAHDFNNLLGAVVGNINLAQLHMRPGADPLQSLENALEAVRQASELTRRFITFSAGGDPAKVIAPVRSLVCDAVSLSLSGSNVKVECDFGDDLWEVEVDPAQMRQAISCIAINAREAMPRGGVIKVVAENVRGRPPGAQPALPDADERYLKLTIRDQGKGIPPGDLSKIFDPYFSTKQRGCQRGMGLGLAIALSIVTRHRGHITVESQPGTGAAFHVYLPAMEKKTSREAEPLKLTPAARTSGKVRLLLLEDEELVANMAVHMLRHLGYEDVEHAREGTEAIERFRRARESGAPFDLSILDLTVKGGTGGKDVIKTLIEIDPAVRAIVSSGYSGDPVMSRFAEYGFCGSLPKPYGIRELKEALEAAMKVAGKP